MEKSYKTPYEAVRYAKYISKEPDDDSRRVACEDPECAFEYAKYVDEQYHPDTYKAVKGSPYHHLYINELGIGDEEFE